MNHVDTLRKATKPKDSDNDQALKELVSRSFSTRNLLHFKHLETNSYAKHIALNELYDEIIDDIDEIVESYQGKFGAVKGFFCVQEKGDCIKTTVEKEMNWLEENRAFISKGFSGIEGLIDNLLADYSQTLYKLNSLE